MEGGEVDRGEGVVCEKDGENGDGHAVVTRGERDGERDEGEEDEVKEEEEDRGEGEEDEVKEEEEDRREQRTSRRKKPQQVWY